MPRFEHFVTNDENHATDFTIYIVGKYTPPELTRVVKKVR
jgi:hypothetical protein